MGRRSHSQTLHLWANGDYVGRWTINANGDSELAYDVGWRQSRLGRPISLSLPFNMHGEPLKGANVSNYFEGLLPDSDIIRKRVATRFKTGSLDSFDLLAAVGRDCVGALQLLPEGATPEKLVHVDGITVSEEDIERHLLEVVSLERHGAVDDADDDFRISLAGAQEKDAFLWWDGKWMKPRGATPTTHIFKLPIGMVGGKRADFTTSVDNEWLCLRLFKEFGLPTANAEIATFGAQRVLVVERFDRTRSANGKQLFRLVQEDFCQATGTSPLLKYENDGGPGLKQMFTLLQQSRDSAADMHTLMASQLLFWMLRAPDGHAKNFSIQLLAGAGRFKLTPIYDVMSAYPVIGPGPNQWSERKLKLAMALLGNNRHYLAHGIERRHFNSTAKEVGYGVSAEPLLQDFIARTPAVVDKVRSELPVGFSEKVADKILGGLLASAAVLQRMPPA
ncbi:type II toxin-antitoxin system HipA family toxin [Janthinobacterium sp. NKUCC06_STL]|uniref:type II toxin-antitoxin system HipA family toxin n=1 Tax=Janthinobacterium sp. NKUCC06_STL TaxID=2842127 RepID=UPI001C5A6623|nr:type II toxin-antitoxin system HipA family toxin [Janthinobacterium sp. NKUCC06_STL]MBW3510077.1 type II toxin-antitoxin system HipA family toxin [Janthinobacterium sp. NKUCC06_STL]